MQGHFVANSAVSFDDPPGKKKQSKRKSSSIVFGDKFETEQTRKGINDGLLDANITQAHADELGESGMMAIFSFLPLPFEAQITGAFGKVFGRFFAKEVALTSAEMGKLIGWGTGQSTEAISQTIKVTANLSESQVKNFAEQGLTKEWVSKQLQFYNQSIEKGGAKLNNSQLIPRKELMETILKLWK